MYKLFLAIMLFLISGEAIAQEETIRQQATAMGSALIKKDYTAFVGFAYPEIVKEMGGKEKMAGTIQQQMEGIEKGGSKIVALEYGSPSVILKEKKELQCTIPQIMTLQVNGGKVMAKSTLIALSQDNGAHWFFVDAGERDLTTVRISLPNISKRLVLPAPEPPKFVKE